MFLDSYLSTAGCDDGGRPEDFVVFILSCHRTHAVPLALEAFVS